MTRHFYIASGITVLALTIWILLLARSPGITTFALKVPESGIATTAEFPVLKKVLQDKIALVKNDSGLLRPYNHDVLSVLAKAADKATTIDQLGAIHILLPNNSIGTAPLAPLNGKPEDTTLFQFEQGAAGWYWGYATYPTSNIMYYIVRLELGTPEIRAKYNLPLGSTTVYSVSVGAGNGAGTWSYSPYSICRGSYAVTGKDAFVFQTVPESTTKTQVRFAGNAQGFTLCFACGKGSAGSGFGAYVELDKDGRVANYAAPKGCAPCVSGAGTLYWSYPQLNARKGAINLAKASCPSPGTLSGDGWLDHQWMRGNDPKALAVQAVTTVTQLSKAVGGLGRYVWINLHLKNNTEYLVTAFPSPDAKIGKNQTYSAAYKKYGASQKTVSPSRSAPLEFLETTTVQDPGSSSSITYPTVFQITIEGHKYTIDTRPYGDCVTLDLTGNLHWSGSATLKSDGGPDPSSAFVELNQFQGLTTYRTNLLHYAGIPKASNEVFFGPPLRFYQTIPTMALMLLGPMFLAATVVFLIFGIRGKRSSR